jgi:hypothetical protein
MPRLSLPLAHPLSADEAQDALRETKMNNEMIFLPYEPMARCDDCYDAYIWAMLGVSWNPIRWFYNPEPRTERMSRLHRFDNGHLILHLCGKHYAKRTGIRDGR